MIQGIDHIVIVVGDLESAITDYSRLGFTVIRGGRHSRLNSENALVAFADGAYFELIAFFEPRPAEPHWWQAELQKGGSLADFCVRSDGVEHDAGAFRHAGASIGAPFQMGRERPDGYQVSWVLAVNEGESRGLVPFFIRDITPRDERVPRERSHPNGTKGIASLTVVAADAASIAAIYEAAMDESGEPITRSDLAAGGMKASGSARTNWKSSHHWHLQGSPPSGCGRADPARSRSGSTPAALNVAR
ncbi:MAG TPA: VOC family protein [Candidatus Binataceae bacterium]|nr:VOC family protein [Candidatus Binataceae bacterium]